MAEWKWDEAREAWRKELWIAGTRTKLTFHGTKKEAQEYEARKRIELGATGVVRQKDAPAFESFCVEVYKPHAKTTLRASTWSVRRYQLEPLIDFFKLTRLTKITPVQIEAYKQRRITEVAKVTINDELKILSVVLAYARHLGLPCAAPKITKYAVTKKKGNAKAYTREEVGFILAGAASIDAEFFALVRFLAETGCRRSEAINLPWSRVDLKQAMVRIWSDAEGDADEDDEYEVKSRDREVTLPDGLLRVLKEQKLRVGDSDWVFPVRTNRASRGDRAMTKGERYANWPKYTWARALAKANVLAKKKDGKARAISGGPHRLRHTFASAFLERKPDLFALGRVLGHSHTRVTELYSHLLPDHLATTRNVVTFDVPSVSVGGVRGRNPTQTPPRG